MNSAKSDLQSRKWNVTINNPVDKGWSHKHICDVIDSFKNISYYCLSDEKGSCFHTHIFLYSKSPVRFSTLKKKFPEAHIEKAQGSCIQNRSYIFKEGDWLDSDKSETNIRDSHFEYGILPEEHQGERTDLACLYEMIKNGASDVSILDANPKYINQINHIDKVRQAILHDTFKDVFRKITVTYMFGKSGAGKSRSVMEHFGYSNVYRITNYAHPWDLYSGQDVILFEEFRNSIPLSDMLNFLDGYPVVLPARYSDKFACFTKVFIISNIDLKSQYLDVQIHEAESWEAFLRRINYVIRFDKDKKTTYKTSANFARTV